ncbi:hypothetical protein NDA03_25805 [Trichocoleus sp. Lan]|uniref:hypothetical protein n=1 Tax=Trichocoleus sp. Lan TaxID=2933927 RepID=UPI003296F6C3
MKETTCLGLVVCGIGLYFWMKPAQPDNRDLIIQQQEQQIQQLQAEQRGMERALGLSR